MRAALVPAGVAHLRVIVSWGDYRRRPSGPEEWERTACSEGVAIDLTAASEKAREILVPGSGGLRVADIEKYSAARKVPVLIVDGDPVWDSLAICETAAEMHPERHLWPEDEKARRVARSACAEMHSGFQALRGSMPMNIRSSHPGKGLTPESRRDVDRVVALWTGCRKRFGGAGNFLFGRFSIADAFYAPPLTPVDGTAQTQTRHIGWQASTLFEWRITAQLELAGTYVRFEPHSVARQAGGRDGKFFGAWVQWAF